MNPIAVLLAVVVSTWDDDNAARDDAAYREAMWSPYESGSWVARGGRPASGGGCGTTALTLVGCAIVAALAARRKL